MDLVKAGPHHFGNSSLLVHVHSSMRQGSSVELYIRSLGTSIHDRWGLTTTIVFVGFQLMPRTQNSSSIYSLPRCYGGPERDDPASALCVNADRRDRLCQFINFLLFCAFCQRVHTNIQFPRWVHSQFTHPLRGDKSN